MAACTHETTEDGFDLVRLQNACLSVSVLPQLGGKILHLIDLRSGRDWLWKNPHLPLCEPAPGMDYERELDSGGWDEVLFSVKPCTIDLAGGRETIIGDHGSLICVPWKVLDSSDGVSDEAVLEMMVQGQDPSFEWRRRIVVDRILPRLTIEYWLTNTDAISWPWLWCAHPLIAIEQGMRIEVTKGQEMRREDCSQRKKRHMAWPVLETDDGAPIDLGKVFSTRAGGLEPDDFCAKLYVRSDNQVSVSTANRAETVNISYDASRLPWLGLWINQRGWSGCGSEPYLNLGLEPATAPYDDLTDAIAQGEADFLAPAESKYWTLTVDLEQGGSIDD